MRQSKVCPKCGYNAITRIVGKPRLDDSHGDYLYTGWAQIACISRYICLTCGYSEEYFEGGNLDRIRGKYGWNYK